MNKAVELFNGYLMPIIGLGTCKSHPVEAAIETAIAAGYRHIDTAAVYGNEAAIGTALRKLLDTGAVKREELFIVTKLAANHMRESDIERGLAASLERLQLDYVDMYLLHVPYGYTNEGDDLYRPTHDDGTVKLDPDTDHHAIWRAMEQQVEAGRARSIGVSNFNEKQISGILSFAKIQPACNQVELHAKFQQKAMLQYCNKHNIALVAYAPLGSPARMRYFEKRKQSSDVIPDLLREPTVAAIASCHGKTPAQVLLNHLTSKSIVVIPKSTNPGRIKENLDFFDFTLSDKEVNKLDDLDIGVDGRSFAFSLLFKGVGKHPEYPFEK